MFKESDGQNSEILKWALRGLVALGSFASWYIKLVVTRYYDRKEKAKEQTLERLLAEDIRERRQEEKRKEKSHTHNE